MSIAELQAEVERLKAENERLTEALQVPTLEVRLLDALCRQRSGRLSADYHKALDDALAIAGFWEFQAMIWSEARKHCQNCGSARIDPPCGKPAVCYECYHEMVDKYIKEAKANLKL